MHHGLARFASTGDDVWVEAPTLDEALNIVHINIGDTYMITNLVTFYSVSLPERTILFLDQDKARQYCADHNHKLEEEFARWEAGEVGYDGLIQSNLECDVDGYAVQTYTIRPDLWLHYTAHPVGSTTPDRWQHGEGCRIKWGNLATLRPPKQ